MKRTNPEKEKKIANCDVAKQHEQEQIRQAQLTHYVKEDLKMTYRILFDRTEADHWFKELEERVTYFTGQLSQVKIFGKWMDIPRQQAAYGDEGLSYKFSGNSIPAMSWNTLQPLQEIKRTVEKAMSNPECRFNFVLINRYNNGNDYMGEHRDDEKELDPNSPIASVSFGETRDFVLRHKDNRGKHRLRRDLLHVTLALQHGSLLIMESPTNHFWYHSLPKRKKVRNPRINLTFRVMKL